MSEAEQQPLVDITMIIADAGLAITLVVLAALMIWRLVDLFQAQRPMEQGGGRSELETQNGRMQNAEADRRSLSTCYSAIAPLIAD